MLTFTLAIFLLIITPGPGVLSTAGVGAAFGFRAGFGYVAGLFIGNNLVGLAVISGLAAIVFAVPYVRQVLLVLSVIYLCYLAFRIAFAGSKIAFIEARKQPGILQGIMLQAINPKAYAVNTTLFTGFAFYPESLITEILLKFLILNLIWVPIHLLWLMAGNVVQKMNLPAKTQRVINGLMALALLSVVALAVISLI